MIDVTGWTFWLGFIIGWGFGGAILLAAIFRHGPNFIWSRDDDKPE